MDVCLALFTAIVSAKLHGTVIDNLQSQWIYECVCLGVSYSSQQGQPYDHPNKPRWKKHGSADTCWLNASIADRFSYPVVYPIPEHPSNLFFLILHCSDFRETPVEVILSIAMVMNFTCRCEKGLVIIIHKQTLTGASMLNNVNVWLGCDNPGKKKLTVFWFLIFSAARYSVHIGNGNADSVKLAEH